MRIGLLLKKVAAFSREIGTPEGHSRCNYLWIIPTNLFLALIEIPYVIIGVAVNLIAAAIFGVFEGFKIFKTPINLILGSIFLGGLFNKSSTLLAYLLEFFILVLMCIPAWK